MKKTLIAFAALTAIAGAAQAQSTVTLYGVADVYAGQKSTTVGGTKLKQTVVDSNGMNTSRFGFRGTEDLGSGLKAIFTMEAGLLLDSGSANQNGGGLFSRQTFVGLSGNFGTATLGRQYTAYDALFAGTNNSYDATYFATTANVWNNGVAGYSSRANNSFAYASPVFSGFSGAFVLAGGEDKTAAVKASRSNSFHVKYANGPLLVGYAYQNEKFNAGSTVASLTPNTATGDRTYNLFAGSYDFGVAKVTGGYNTAKQERSTPAAANGKDKEFQVGVSAPFGAATVAAGYTRSKADNSDRRGTGYSLLGTYDLSKRTRLYAGGLNEKYTGTAVTLTRRQGVVAGVRHAF
jgi:predicted porin